MDKRPPPQAVIYNDVKTKVVDINMPYTTRGQNAKEPEGLTPMAEANNNRSKQSGQNHQTTAVNT